VRVRPLHRQRHLADDLAVRVHLDDAAVAALGNHRAAVRQPLEGVNLDAPLVVAGRLRVVPPHDLLVRRHLGHGRRAGVEEEVPVRQEVDVVRVVLAVHLPLDLAVLTDERDAALVLRQDAVRGRVGRRRRGE
jgi:hypothetical protein